MAEARKPAKEILFPIDWNYMHIKKTRTDLGLTQDEVAEYLGISKSTIRKFESGNSVSPVMLIAYGSLLERYAFYKERCEMEAET